jgi:divalent metal cation (Fe/Co/Zn/Cd) transporter
VPEVDAVQTHLEPLAETAHGERLQMGLARGAEEQAIRAIVRDEIGSEPREVRLVATDEGVVAFLTLGLGPSVPLARAHELADRVESRLRTERLEVAGVVVHTEP